MARKKLLSEGEIRQFMKLANLRPVGQRRLSEMYDMPGARDEEAELDATEDELGAEDALANEEGDELDAMAMDDAGGGDMVSMDDFMSALERAIEDVTGEEADVSEEPGDEELEMDMEMGPEGDEMEMDVEEEPMMEGEEEDMAAARKQRKERERHEREKRGRRSEGLADAKHGERRTGRMQRKGKRPEDDAPVGDIMTGDDSEVLPDDDSDSAVQRRGRKSSGHRPDRMEEDIVNEVAKRVAARLQAESRQDQMVDQLAERIMKRLTKK
jgi:hypothetical protein